MEQKAYRHHKAIFEAIEARDPDAAERAIEQHLSEVVAAFWKIKATKATRPKAQGGRVELE
jgi:DNA-binding FadR family transcriptional regulator